MIRTFVIKGPLGGAGQAIHFAAEGYAVTAMRVIERDGQVLIEITYEAEEG